MNFYVFLIVTYQLIYRDPDLACGNQMVFSCTKYMKQQRACCNGAQRYSESVMAYCMLFIASKHNNFKSTYQAKSRDRCGEVGYKVATSYIIHIKNLYQKYRQIACTNKVLQCSPRPYGKAGCE